MPTHIEVNTLNQPTPSTITAATQTETQTNTQEQEQTPKPIVFTRIRGQVLTVLIAKGHYRLRTITPRDCFNEPNFLLDITQEAYNIISNERDHILGKYFRECRSDYSFGYKLDNKKLDGLASVSQPTNQRSITVRFYNCALTPSTVEGLRTTRGYMEEVGDYLMFHIIHWQPKSLVNSETPVPLYRYKFIDGRFFKSVEEWELFLFQLQSLRQQQYQQEQTKQTCEENGWSIGEIQG